MDCPFPAGMYKFTQEDRIPNRKSMIFVKLTDSAHRALNNYLKNQDTCRLAPMIEFSDEETGLIEIPNISKAVTETQACMAQFKFNVESNVAMQGLQGRFECIKCKRGSKKIHKCGPLMKRLKIHANDDVYETTKNRMAEAELEQRKICTKEIDLKLETVNCQVKIERNVKSKNSITAPVLPTPIAREMKSIKLGLQRLSKTRNRSQNVMTKLDSPIARRPLKERIIHMLAVKPLKKIELSVALRREGLRDCDKSHINSTLMSVATVKDNVYHLLRHVWNDVLEDWPFYNELQRQEMNKNKPQNLIPPNFGLSTGSNLSPGNTSSADRSPSRPGYIKGVDGLPTKRLRISHFNRSNFVPLGPNAKDRENSDQISPSRVTNGFDDIIEKFGLSNATINSSFKFNSKPCFRNGILQESTMKTDTKNKSILIRDKYDGMNAPTQSDIVKREKCNLEMVKNDNCNLKEFTSEDCDLEKVEKTATSIQISLSEGLPYMCSIDSHETSSYEEEYVTITSTEQRRQYKNDFIEYYDEYMLMNEEVMEVTGEFIQLKKLLRQYEKGSSGYLEIEKSILEKYNQVMHTDFYRKKKRHNYLHNLLTHIKKLVYEYDDKML